MTIGDLGVPHAAEVKACCARAYQQDIVALVLGDSYHPGGLDLTRHLAASMGLARGERVLDVASGPGTSAFLLAYEVGAEVVGVDFRVPLDEATRRIGPQRAVQGNLDPALLFAPPEVLDARVRATVEAGRSAPGHVFNLGHGVPPNADPARLQRVVELVHSIPR